MSLHRFAIVLALTLALLGSAGSLTMSLGLGLEACTLCFYQRAFVLGCLAVLGVGLIARTRTNLAILTLPLAVAGFTVALQHTRLVLNGVLECPDGVLGLGSAPLQSLVLHALLLIALGLGCFSGTGDERGSAVGGLAGVVLGMAIGWACLNSNPPLKTPTRAYDPVQEPLVGCRKPWRGAN